MRVRNKKKTTINNKVRAREQIFVLDPVKENILFIFSVFKRDYLQFSMKPSDKHIIGFSDDFRGTKS